MSDAPALQYPAARYALVANATGGVDRIIPGPLSDLYVVLDGHSLVATDTAWVGYVYDAAAGSFSPPPTPTLTADELAELKSGLGDRIDARAEALRLTLITPGSGQAMEYQEAYAEAVQVDAAVKAGQAIDASAFPMLSASLGLDKDPATGQPTVDIPGEARAVLAAYDAYQRAGAAIRGVRLRAKAAIDAALDEAGALAAFAAVVWPSFS